MAARVNRPTNLKVKEADVNRKLQFYGIISAFQQGKAPSVRFFFILIVWGLVSLSNKFHGRTTKSMLP